MLSLLGLAVIAVGLALRLNPLLVVTAGALAAGVAGGLSPLEVVAALGRAFNDARFVTVAFLVLPVIAILERAGLQARAQALVARLETLSAARLIAAYFAVRQLSAAVGLLALGGQATMVRPLVAPMAIAAERRRGALNETQERLIAAHAAAADNIGAFFGEDIFVAVGSVLLIAAVLAGARIAAAPLTIALWAIPTALVAFGVHIARLWLLDRALAREATSP